MRRWMDYIRGRLFGGFRRDTPEAIEFYDNKGRLFARFGLK